jgi:hypothetical protein
VLKQNQLLPTAAAGVFTSCDSGSVSASVNGWSSQRERVICRPAIAACIPAIEQGGGKRCALPVAHVPSALLLQVWTAALESKLNECVCCLQWQALKLEQYVSGLGAGGWNRPPGE